MSEYRFWVPPRGRRMSFSGGVVLWFFFWWLLIPAWLVYAMLWVAMVVVVNAMLLSVVLLVAVLAGIQHRRAAGRIAERKPGRLPRGD